MSSLKLQIPVAYFSCFLWCQHTACVALFLEWKRGVNAKRGASSTASTTTPPHCSQHDSNGTHHRIIIPTHSTKIMAPITAPVSAPAVGIYITSAVPNNYEMCWVDCCASQYRYTAGACSDDTKRCLAGSSSYNYYRAAAVHATLNGNIRIFSYTY